MSSEWKVLSTNRRLFSATHFVNSSRTFSVTVKV